MSGLLLHALLVRKAATRADHETDHLMAFKQEFGRFWTQGVSRRLRPEGKDEEMMMMMMLHIGYPCRECIGPGRSLLTLESVTDDEPFTRVTQQI